MPELSWQMVEEEIPGLREMGMLNQYDMKGHKTHPRTAFSRGHYWAQQGCQRRTAGFAVMSRGGSPLWDMAERRTGMS